MKLKRIRSLMLASGERRGNSVEREGNKEAAGRFAEQVHSRFTDYSFAIAAKIRGGDLAPSVSKARFTPARSASTATQGSSNDALSMNTLLMTSNIISTSHDPQLHERHRSGQTKCADAQGA